MYSKAFSFRNAVHHVPDLRRTVRLFAESIGTTVDEDRWGCHNNASQAICKNGRLICAKRVWWGRHDGYADSVVVAATGIAGRETELGFLAKINGEKIASAKYVGGDMFELEDGSLV